MSKGKKVAVALTRALLGVIGIDCFIMAKPTVGVGRIVLTLVLALLPLPLSLLKLIPALGSILYWVCLIVIIAYALARIIALMVTGFALLNKTEEEIKEKYLYK